MSSKQFLAISLLSLFDTTMIESAARSHTNRHSKHTGLRVSTNAEIKQKSAMKKSGHVRKQNKP